MKILFCAPQPFFRIRGTPINVRNIVTALGEGGHEVDLLCYPFGEDVEIENVNVLRTPGVPGVKDVKIGPSLAKIPLDALMMAKAFWLCARNKYDVIHAVEESAFFCVLLKKLFGTKFIYDMDSVISDQLRYSGFTAFRPFLALAEKWERTAMRNADFAITVCDSLTRTIEKRSPGTKVVQIEDAPLQQCFQEDHERADKLRNELDLKEAPCVIYTGNLENYQGVDLLVRAAARVYKSNRRIRFVIVGGEKPRVDRLRELAANLDIADICLFTGKRPMNEMPAFMTMASVLVSPRTKGTNTALKIYTYMQSGCPIVATKLATHTQVLDETCSFLVPPQADDLAEGILAALKDPVRNAKLTEEARKRVASRYSLPRFNNEVRTAYQSLQGQCPRPKKRGIKKTRITK